MRTRAQLYSHGFLKKAGLPITLQKVFFPGKSQGGAGLGCLGERLILGHLAQPPEWFSFTSGLGGLRVCSFPFPHLSGDFGPEAMSLLVSFSRSVPGHLSLTCEQTWPTDFQLKFEFIFHWVGRPGVQESGQTQLAIGVLGLGAEAVWVFARKGMEKEEEEGGGGGRGSPDRGRPA